MLVRFNPDEHFMQSTERNLFCEIDRPLGEESPGGLFFGGGVDGLWVMRLMRLMRFIRLMRVDEG